MKIKHEYSESELAEIVRKHIGNRRPKRKVLAVLFRMKSLPGVPVSANMEGVLSCEVEFEDEKGDAQ